MDRWDRACLRFDLHQHPSERSRYSIKNATPKSPQPHSLAGQHLYCGVSCALSFTKGTEISNLRVLQHDVQSGFPTGVVVEGTGVGQEAVEAGHGGGEHARLPVVPAADPGQDAVTDHSLTGRRRHRGGEFGVESHPETGLG